MLGVCYYPEHWPESWWAEDAARMHQLGIRFVRIGEFAWSRIEPEPGRFDWGWLDRAVDLLHAHGLQVVMGTPTATPPKWLVDANPAMLPVDAQGRVRGFGSRRHYNFSDPGWLAACERIVTAVAERYGRHPAVVGWQTDNEYGCHDTVLSYAAADRFAFRDWLRRRHQDPTRLNEAWGAAFWSMEVSSFDQVEPPNLTVTEANPAARLDYWRFCSEQVAAFNRRQVEILRRLSPGRWITHNFMGFFHDFDHWAVGADLDLASWDSYPIGFVERFLPEAEKNRWATTSHPDIAPFHHDLYRGVGRGRFWVMEQQPGPVNWAAWNPIPAPGMIRLFTWEALAHGAECVSYFRWRQAPFAQEQHHAGLNLPDRTLSPGGHEAARVGEELRRIELPMPTRAPVALVFDYESSWRTRIQPQGQDFRYDELTFRWYEAVRRLGQDVDIVQPGAALDGYRLVLVPTLIEVTDAALRAFQGFDGPILFGPRSGSRDRHHAIPAELPPGPLQGLIPIRIVEVGSLRPGLERAVTGAVEGRITRWLDRIETALEPLARCADGAPALVAHGSRHYLAGWPDRALLTATLRHLLVAAELPVLELPEALRLRRRGDLTFAFNYGPDPLPVPAPAGATFLLGGPQLPAHDVACWRG